MNSRGDFHSNIFINCPFDDDYTRLLRPLLFSAVRAGLTVRIASEIFDSGVARIHRICDLVRESKYSVHDLSRMRASFEGEIHRMNMPFELGLDIGCRVFSRGLMSQKRCLILETEQYEYQKALSDLSNSDIKRHRDEPEELIRQVRNWFVEVGINGVPSGTMIWEQFNEFMANFYHEREAEGFRGKDLDMMPVPEYLGFIEAWVG